MSREFFTDQDGRWWSETTLRKDFAQWNFLQYLFQLFAVRMKIHEDERYYNIEDIREAKMLLDKQNAQK